MEPFTAALECHGSRCDTAVGADVVVVGPHAKDRTGRGDWLSHTKTCTGGCGVQSDQERTKGSGSDLTGHYHQAAPDSEWFQIAESIGRHTPDPSHAAHPYKDHRV